MENLAAENFDFADSYLTTIAKVATKQHKRFDNDLLYNMIAISFEKFMIAWLASYDSIATSHLPLMLYRELKHFDPSLSDSIKKTAILIGSFEGICSIEDFGYRTPSDAEVDNMVAGLNEVREAVSQRLTPNFERV